MNPEVVATGIKHAHVAGQNKGMTQGVAIVGALGVLVVVGLLVYSSADKKVATGQARVAGLSEGLEVAQQSYAQTQERQPQVRMAFA